MGKWKVPYHGATEEFLRAHVNHEGDDCLHWPYARTRLGYGIASVNGRQSLASNLMCRLAHGEPYLIWNHAAHRCHNPSCVNPKHLRWATHAENMADKEEAGTVNRGERNGKTRLTAADVLAIRNAPPDLAALTERYGVSKRCISHIRGGRRWQHVGGPRTCKDRNKHPMCRHGHPYDEANTQWTKDGYRQCRTCNREGAKRRRHELMGVVA